MKLKQILKSQGRSQLWLAGQLGVSNVTIGNWNRGRTRPSFQHIEKICQILNIQFDDLKDQKAGGEQS